MGLNPCFIVVWIALGYAGGVVAARKGYSTRWGVLLAILFGPFALLVTALLPSTGEGRVQEEYERKLIAEAAEASNRRTCPQCGREVAGTTQVCPRCNTRFT
jgi:hypothetical protein